jgi:hypothetical protein
MKKPHKHAELIKAWADGAEIQVFLSSENVWIDDNHPDWYFNSQYRIKPQPKIVKAYMHYGHIEYLIEKSDFKGQLVNQCLFSTNNDMLKHLEFTFTDGKLTNVEMKNATY